VKQLVDRSLRSIRRMTCFCTKELPFGDCSDSTCIKILSGVNFLKRQSQWNYNYFINALT